MTASPTTATGDAVASSTAPAARVVDLRKTYGRGETAVHALDGVTLEIWRGEFTAVMGPSGSGKSTLMHCAAGLDAATSGEVHVGDIDITRLKDKALTELRRDRIGFVFQSFNLIPTLNAEENILLPLAIAGRRPEQEWYDTVIETVGLRDRLSHRPSELSGGQQQRVAIVRALAMRPRLMLLDEVTSALDPELVADVLDVIRELAEGGMTMLIATHEMGFARDIANRVCFLDGGVLLEQGPPEAIFSHPQEPRTQQFLQRIIAAGRL
jgi:putative ABC transport system ATP-binding protein